MLCEILSAYSLQVPQRKSLLTSLRAGSRALHSKPEVSQPEYWRTRGPRLLQECSLWSESIPQVTSPDSALWACTGAMRKATTADQVLLLEQRLHDLVLVAPTQPSDPMGRKLAPLSHQP